MDFPKSEWQPQATNWTVRVTAGLPGTVAELGVSTQRAPILAESPRASDTIDIVAHMRQMSHVSDSEANLSRPSEYELRLLRTLWSVKRLSARELHDASRVQTGWGYSATRKTLDRMVKKGLLRIEVVHGLNTYAAAQPKLETLARLIRIFARTVLDSELVPVAAFAHSKLIGRDEVEELESLMRGLAADEANDDEEAA